MKLITFDGRLGKDAEVLPTKNGDKFVRFSVANNSFSNGQEKTDWFDIVSFDPYIVEKKSQYLKKGTYVIVSGPIDSVVTVSNGKVYMNHHVTAVQIETPRFGKDAPAQKQEEEESDEPQVSVYTGGTPSTVTAQQEPTTHVETPTAAPAYSTSVSADDDLPF